MVTTVCQSQPSNYAPTVCCAPALLADGSADAAENDQFEDDITATLDVLSLRVIISWWSCTDPYITLA